MSKAPPPCDTDIYKHGDVVCITVGPTWTIEAWVKRLSEKSGQKCDWHCVGGRAVVRTLGNLDAAQVSAQLLRESSPEPDYFMFPEDS